VSQVVAACKDICLTPFVQSLQYMA